MPTPYKPTRSRPSSNKYARLFTSFRGQQRKTQVCPPAPILDGKLAVVTGGSAGIGAEIVKGLARRGADCVVLARGNEETGSFCRGLSQETGRQILFVPMDLSHLATVMSAAFKIAQIFPNRTVDILCANAGIWPDTYAVSKDGFESAFAVNCLGHHVLIRTFLEQGQLAKGSRVVGTTGDIYILSRACTADYWYEGRGTQAYARSKLGNLWQYGELARRHPDLHVSIVHPGIVASGLEGSTTGIVGYLKHTLFISEELGAQASLIAATQPSIASGDYFHNMHGVMNLPANDPAQHREAAQEFWELMEGLIKEKPFS